MNERYTSIAGLQPKEPIGAVLSVGRKTADGTRIQPKTTDRFWLVMPDMANGVRDLHPAFRAFNSLGEWEGDQDGAKREAERAMRRSVRGMLVHVTRAECFEHHLKAQRLPRHDTHPNDIPTCVGDGAQATRWVKGEFRSIVCPNEACEFRQGEATPCKPWMRLLFRIEWPDGNPLPKPLVKLTSRSWNSTAAFLGLFGEIERRAKALGLERYSLAGLRILITLSKKTSRKGGGRAFPVLRPSIDMDLEAFLFAQHQRFQTIGGAPIAALTDRAEQDPAVVAADLVTISPSNRELSVPVGSDRAGREPGDETEEEE